MSDDFKHKELTRQSIGAAMEVLNELRSGQDERIYERALEVELGLRGIGVTDFHEQHVAQMLGNLAITGLAVALLPNFKHAKLEWKRISRSQP